MPEDDGPRGPRRQGRRAPAPSRQRRGPRARPRAAQVARGRPAAGPAVRAGAHLRLHVNGESREIVFAPHKTLLEVLREDLGLTGTKHGCELGECGTCTVLLDGKPQLSCLVLGLECEDRPIVTVEGLADGPPPHPLQTAFAELGTAQSSYCTPRILCAAKALLDRSPAPTRQEIKEALSGNLCRCTGYIKIFEAEGVAPSRRRDPRPQPGHDGP